MGKWWIFDGREARGPFDLEDLKNKVPGLGPESVVAPDGAINPEAWKPAGRHPELSGLFSKPPPLPIAQKPPLPTPAKSPQHVEVFSTGMASTDAASSSIFVGPMWLLLVAFFLVTIGSYLTGKTVFLLPAIIGIITLSAICVYLDATANKIGKVPGDRGTFNMSAGAWGSVTLGLWIVGFPAYLLKRASLLERARENPIGVGGRMGKAILLGGVGGLFFFFTLQGEPSREVGPVTPERIAQKAAEDIVKNSLQSPATMKIIESRLLDHNADRYLSAITVDSQNGFGATIRNTFLVSLRLDLATGQYTWDRQKSVLTTPYPVQPDDVARMKWLNEWPGSHP